MKGLCWNITGNISTYGSSEITDFNFHGIDNWLWKSMKFLDITLNTSCYILSNNLQIFAECISKIGQRYMKYVTIDTLLKLINIYRQLTVMKIVSS